MPKLSAFAVDVGKARDGVWAWVGPNFYMRIARHDDARYAEELRRLTETLGPVLARGALADEQSQRLLREATCALITAWGAEANGQTNIAGHVITDAEDLLEEDGQTVIPCTPENARRIVMDPKQPRFWELLARIANNDDLYREKTIEAIAGNSPAPSDGTPTSEAT